MAAKTEKIDKHSANHALDDAEALLGNFVGGPADNQMLSNQVNKADWLKLRQKYA